MLTALSSDAAPVEGASNAGRSAALTNSKLTASLSSPSQSLRNRLPGSIRAMMRRITFTTLLSADCTCAASIEAAMMPGGTNGPERPCSVRSPAMW